MEKAELQELLQTPAKLVETISALAPVIPEEAINFEPEQHKIVTDTNYRPDRKVDVPDGTPGTGEDQKYRSETKPVHRIPSAIQKQIIESSVTFALGGGVKIGCKPREGNATDQMMLDMVQTTLDDCKFDYLAQEIERLKQRFLTVMLVWYSVPAEEGFWDELGITSKFKMRCTILSPKDGDIIIPLRDQYKDMIGAARKYKVKIGDKEVEKMDLFTNEAYFTFVQGEAGWDLEVKTPIPYGKANFILDEQERPEWADVSAKIERLEEVTSDTADENQISAFPILAATGDIKAVQGGGANTRKTVTMENGGDLKYVEAKGGDAGAVAERKNLRSEIFKETATPDFDFETISGDLPGVTIEMMLLPTTNKAKSKQMGSIGMFHQRNFNFLKSAMAVINTGVKGSVSLKMTPVFSIPLPRNLSEIYKNITLLVGAGLMSKETAIAELGIVDDVDIEYEKIKAEAKEAAVLAPNPVLPTP